MSSFPFSLTLVEDSSFLIAEVAYRFCKFWFANLGVLLVKSHAVLESSIQFT